MLPTHAQHLPLPKFKIPLMRKAMPAVQLIDEALSLPHPIPVMGELVIGRYGIVGDWNIHSRKMASMSRGEDFQDSLLKYRGSLFVNFARSHLLGWILSTQRRLLLTASYVGHIHSFSHLQTTTPTPTVTIQLPIISLYRTFRATSRWYIHHRKTGISPLLPSYPFLPIKKTVKMTACLL